MELYTATFRNLVQCIPTLRTNVLYMSFFFHIERTLCGLIGVTHFNELKIVVVGRIDC